MTHILSVSLPDQHYKFLKDSNLSPSRVLQDAIIYMDSENVTSMLKHNKELREVKQRLIKFIGDKNLLQEYSKYVLEENAN